MTPTRKGKATKRGEGSASKTNPPKAAASSKIESANSKGNAGAQPEILGGLNGDYRITGSEKSSTFKTFTIPTEKDKVIPCQLYGNPPASSESGCRPSSSRILIFTHGAGGGLENPATQLFAEGYASSGTPVLCFQGTMNLQNRTKSFETVFQYCEENYPGCEIAVGGRSMGARAAVLLALDHEEIRTLVLSSYPLTSPKGEMRDKILVNLSKDKYVCFLSGDRDSMCDIKDLSQVRQRMVAKTKIILVKNGDHGMSLVAGKSKGDAVEQIRRKGGEICAEWVRRESDIQGRVVLEWDKDEKNVIISDQLEDGEDVAAKPKSSGPKQKGGNSRSKHLNETAKPDTQSRKRKAETEGSDKAHATKATKAKRTTTSGLDQHISKKEESAAMPRRSSRLKN